MLWSITVNSPVKPRNCSITIKQATRQLFCHGGRTSKERIGNWSKGGVPLIVGTRNYSVVYFHSLYGVMTFGTVSSKTMHDLTKHEEPHRQEQFSVTWRDGQKGPKANIVTGHSSKAKLLKWQRSIFLLVQTHIASHKHSRTHKVYGKRHVCNTYTRKLTPETSKSAKVSTGGSR